VETKSFSCRNLEELHERSPVRTLEANRPVVIFSDLHMGNGSRNDDFLHNSDLFFQVLTRHYRPGGFDLILNGDVEELQRFPQRRIRTRWQKVFDVFGVFARESRFTRIVGNHDLDDPDENEGVVESLRLLRGDDELFIFHGHQTSQWIVNHNRWIQFFLRYGANPLHVKNHTVAHNSRKRFRTERRAYDFASRKKVLAIIGHTHRPLFESMSKIDSIQFEIERLCRKYPKSDQPKKIERQVGLLKADLLELADKEAHRRERGSLYRDHLVVPGLFNSGCVLGKRGMTALEINDGIIRLVYWYDATRPQKYIDYRGKDSTPIAGTDYHRLVVKKESLDYIFSRIRLLA